MILMLGVCYFLGLNSTLSDDKFQLVSGCVRVARGWVRMAETGRGISISRHRERRPRGEEAATRQTLLLPIKEVKDRSFFLSCILPRVRLRSFGPSFGVVWERGIPSMAFSSLLRSATSALGGSRDCFPSGCGTLAPASFKVSSSPVSVWWSLLLILLNILLKERISFLPLLLDYCYESNSWFGLMILLKITYSLILFWRKNANLPDLFLVYWSLLAQRNINYLLLAFFGLKIATLPFNISYGHLLMDYDILLLCNLIFNSYTVLSLFSLILFGIRYLAWGVLNRLRFVQVSWVLHFLPWKRTHHS